MGIGTGLGNLSKDAGEYVKRSIDNCKLQTVEQLSLLIGDMVCGFVVSMLLFIAFLFILSLVTMVLATYIGYLLSVTAVVVLILLLALLAYVFRVPLFVNGVVSRLMALFYGKECDDE